MITSEQTHRIGRRSTVAAGDGTALAVREFGHPDAPLTVVFVHGHCLRMQSWTDLRRQVERSWGDDVRIVMYDHRGHGESNAATPDSCTMDRLGEDLADVIRAVIPSGPFVVVGHSMGGMTALSYARQNPEAIGSRLVGVGLIATSAGGITDDGLGSCLAHPAVSAFRAAVRRAPRLMSGAKKLSRGVCAPIVRTAGCGSRKVSPRVVTLATAMLGETSIVTMAGFLGAFCALDEVAGLAALASIPTLVLCGSDDLMTPMRHSETLAAHLPDTRLVRVAQAGHMVILERAHEVAEAVVELVTAARRAHVADLALAR
ncbi:alpha/beta hydrolase [Rhodococcus sp. 06-462-5]|uniref:alpha/beta fold hydrolase n=1 Tax=unclassified Rhodococcus (in: high G+C Gram-positive bacteria) TaxID=192944 RepID=UPI000B9A6DB8|nr:MULTISPECIES: alpha/beta hydrolase [unclassified Rhodococcus (in: high G+C Gram-positive bacteria)]OZC74254.1 alpha/beta hydrolase [Rhodococcus sp. 06-462-5]OZE65790.1 alpha/beta hydrolase [Rhodococcus sp. 02-925g]